MADYLIANGTDAELTNVNAGGVDVPRRSSGNTITLTDVELAAVCVLPGVAVMKDTSTFQQRREVAKVLKYRKVLTL